MKVLQVNSVYPSWSTGKITHDIHTVLQKEQHQSIVCYGRGPLIAEDGIYKICTERLSRINRAWSRISGIMYGGHYISTRKLIRIIEKKKPDIVHLQCINNAFVNIYALVQYLKEHQVKTILTLHAEFMYTANCGHALDCDRWRFGCGKCPRLKQETHSLGIDSTAYSWYRMKKAFQGFNKNLIVVSVSPWLKNRAEQSPILQDKRHEVIFNGLDTSIFHHHATPSIRQHLGLTDNKMVLHVTPNFTANPSNLKGGMYVINLAKRMPHVTFVVVGPTFGPKPEVPSNMIILGAIEDSLNLAQLYSAADLTLLTSKKETFSMVCAESLSCGTPVVGFKAGAPEQISLPQYSDFVEFGNIEELQLAVKSFLAKPFNHQEISAEACSTYAKEVMAHKYIQLYQQLMNE